MAKPPAFQFYAKDWLSSANVQHMTAVQRGMYIQLLARAWDSEPTGFLPADGDQLWRLAGADSKEQWVKEGGFVLDQFKKRGKFFYHPRLLVEKEKQEMFRRRQSDNGKLGGRPKTTRGLSQSQNNPDLSTGKPALTQAKATESSAFAVASAVCSLQSASAKQELKPSRAASESRFKPFVEVIDAYWKHKNPGVGLTFGASDGKALNLLLADNPQLTKEQFRQCLRHRARSPGTVHTERPRKWLGNTLDYLHGPLDRFNKANGNNANTEPLPANYEPPSVTTKKQLESE